MSISDDVTENINCKKISDFDRATSQIDPNMLRNNGGNNAKPQFFLRISTYICRLVMTSSKIQIAKKFPILTAQPLKSIGICLEIMVVTMRSRNFFSRKSTYICRLVMTSPKIKIAKKLSDFDRATSQIDRNMLRNNGGNNAKPQFFFTKIDLHMSISDDVTEYTNCKEIVRFCPRNLFNRSIYA